MAKFIHLHNHSHYSLLDGACKIPDLVATAKQNEMPALALTDHGNMFGAIEFYQSARKAGIKPIIGVEAYIAPGSRKQRKYNTGISSTSFHVVLLAKNFAGYQNLMRLVSKAYLEGFYYRPRIDKEILREYRDGLVALSACLKGEVSFNMLHKGYDAAKMQALEYREIFGDDYYLEIQNHGIPEEEEARKGVTELSEHLSIPLVATNDIHYLKKDHYLPHDCLICLQTGKDRDDPKRLRYSTDEIYFKTENEMRKSFADQVAALERTQEIADKCNVDIDCGRTYLPNFEIPPEENSVTLDDYLRKLVYQGAQQRFGETTPEVTERLEHELGIISSMGYSGYFLIVRDFIHYAKRCGIPVGPGRGSAAGSLVSYCLEITNINPLEYNLIFERFLNPERVTMPDIDIDFCYECREEVIEYVRNKYGERNVTQIITFGTMAARAVIRDVGRVLKIAYSDVDKIAKMIPGTPGMNLSKALESVPELPKLIDQSDAYRQLIEYGKVLEGFARHASTHAAGVVITPDDLTNYTPLYRSPQGDVTTQYDMKILESIGVLKMDFLGLRTLTVLQKTINALAECGIVIDLDKIPLDDKETFEVFAKGETVAVFQFESSGMREYLRKLKPRVFEDLIAMNALYRPGPMEWIDDFIARKHGKKAIVYLHSLLEPILQETYGIIVYQEQVMRIASVLAGFSMGKADLLRRAMGKKKAALMAEQRALFVSGAAKNDITQELANEIFDMMDKFAGYGFVKPHSTCYALIAFQTAYLKRHYPAEFMASAVSSEMGSTDRVVVLIEECKRMGLNVLPPDVNESFTDFKVIGGAIRFGLGAVKNVGRNAIDCIVQARSEGGRFKSLFEFCERVDSRMVNKKVIESLIQSGAMDSVDGHRAQKMEVVEMAISFAQTAQAEKLRGQTSLFGGADQDNMQYPPLPFVVPWADSYALNVEKEMLGFYVSGHPLAKYEKEVQTFATVGLQNLAKLKDNTPLKTCGIVVDCKTVLDRKNNTMAFVTLEDFTGVAEVVMFASLYKKYRDLLQADKMVSISGRISAREDGDAKIIGQEVVLLDQVWEKFAHNLHLRMDVMGVDDPLLTKVNSIIRKNPGQCNLFIDLKTTEDQRQLIRAKTLKVKPTYNVITELRDLLGWENVWMEGESQDLHGVQERRYDGKSN